MGPFGKFTSKLKSQQKETSKNGKHGIDSKTESPRGHSGPGKKVGDDGSRLFSGHRHHRDADMESKSKQKNVAGTTQAFNRVDLCMSEDPVRTAEKGSRTPDDSLLRRNEASYVDSETRIECILNSKEKKCNLNVENPTTATSCSISSPKVGGEHRLEGDGDGKTKLPSSVFPKRDVVVSESSDLDSSSLSISLGLNRIKTRSGPLNQEIESKAGVSQDSSVKVDKSTSSMEKGRGHKESGKLEKNRFDMISGNQSAAAEFSSKSSQGRFRKIAKDELQTTQRFHSGKRTPDQPSIPIIGQAFSSTVFPAPGSADKKSDEKKVPSSLISYLNNEFDESFELEVASKQLDVIKEADSPTFTQPPPPISHNRIFKKWPKDIKSFSHELGPRGGRPHEVHRPHSDNDLEELLAALRARFNTAKEEVDAELKYLAADLIEILDRNTDSFPEWRENVEDLLVLAQRCTELSPVDFRRECEKIVHELDERRQELPMGLLKQLHTRMLFILTRCTRLLQFQKEASPEEEGLHKVHQCLKGVPSVEQTLTSGASRRGKGTHRKLLPEVLEHSARNDAGVKQKNKSQRKHRLSVDKPKLKKQSSVSPKVDQFDNNDQLNLKKNEKLELPGQNLSVKVIKKVQEESVDSQGEALDQREKGVDIDPTLSRQKPHWSDEEKEEHELVICRICEEQVPTSQLESHSLPCTLADACDAQGGNLDERLRMLAENLERIADVNITKNNHMGVDESPDGFRPFRLTSHDGSDNASPQSSDLQIKHSDGRLDDMAITDPMSVEDLRGLSLINFKRLLGGKGEQVASSSAGSGTPRSALTTPRTSQIDLLWAERTCFAELEDNSQIYDLANLAREAANRGPMEEGALASLQSCLDELHDSLARNKVAALTVETFGKRIEKILREKIYLFEGTGEMRRMDSLSGSFEDDGMSTDDGVQSFKSTPTHPSYNFRISIEDFDILKLISRGAFGRVFLAKKRSTGDLFAIKVLRKIDMIRKNAVENILAERDILITVCNPFVVRFFYSFTCRDNLYLVMEYLNGGDLYSMLRHLGCLEEHVARVYIAELVLALEYLHSLGVVHRDLKPDNILIAHDGHIKLTDFGLSKVGLINSTDDLSGPTNSNVLTEDNLFENCTESAMSRECRKERSAVGTPDYLAPEILLGTEHGYTADWWSVGVILFECITGLPPFNAEHPQIIFDNILNRKIPWPHIPEDMSYEAKDLIDRFLTEDPNHRLGAKGAAEVKSHSFFKDISWENLAMQKAAFVPSPESVEDTSYFTSRHVEGYANSSPRFGDSSDCETSCSSSNSMKVILQEGEDECGDLADLQRSPSVERTFNNFSFKNASQLASMNYDILSQSGRDGQRGHSRNQSMS